MLRHFQITQVKVSIRGHSCVLSSFKKALKIKDSMEIRRGLAIQFRIVRNIILHQKDTALAID